jgi:uncharacterized protein YndB with AHSA1/START domain
MAKHPETGAPPLQLARNFRAPRARVYAAWTDAEQLRRWFCPADYSVPQAQVEPRVGGAFEVCMRSARGEEHWTRGRFTELQPDTRLVIDMQIPGGGAPPLFRALTVVTLADTADGGTRMEVVQSYTLLDPRAEPMVRGAPAGWAQTLDRLARELEHGRAPAAARSVAHASFRLERRYAAAPARVYHALTDPAAKARWFAGGSGYTALERSLDVRNGGRERVQGRWESGLVSTFDAQYLDVVPDERLVYVYTMHLDERKISASLATFELHPEGSGTRLVLTEQGAFLDGYDDAGSRERGTQSLLEALGRAVDG